MNRITTNPDIMLGQPTICGLRITVEQILMALSAGVPDHDLLEDYSGVGARGFTDSEITTTHTNVRANLTQYLDAVIDNRETVVIQRRGREDVIMISADELNSLLETVHLLRSPKNAERLLAALERARAN